jgi:hypothetical protein
MTMLKIYKSRLARIQYVFRDGTVAVFSPRTQAGQGHYLTGNAERIKELDEVCKSHPHLYVDPKELEVDEALADPAVAYREQIRAEERAKVIAELGDPNQMQGISKITLPPGVGKLNQAVAVDAGETSNKPSLGGIGNSATTAAASAESNTK